MKPVAQRIEAQKSTIRQSGKTELFQLHRQQDRKAFRVDQELDKAVFLDIPDANIRRIMADAPEFLHLELPTGSAGGIQLLLYRAELFSDAFEVYASSNPALPVQFERTRHYWGVVDGEPKSLVAISISPEEVMGFVQLGEEHHTLGKLAGSDVTIFYKSDDLRISEPFSCDTDDELHRIGSGDRVDDGGSAAAASPDNCVNMYVEIDHDLVVRRGSVTSALNYVTGIFGQAAILYANESINFDINQIYVWDTEDPYTGPGTSSYLSQFRNEVAGSFNGDLAHLVGDEGSGGIAYVDALCNSNFGVGYSDLIYDTYSNVPVYNWPVEVVTHEIGHNLGSPHTHACAWGPSGDEPIDCCGPNAGYPSNDCSGPCSAGIPTKGTIMSYCHISPNPGIDFNLGFGPQPGDLIRDRVYNANCLSACVSCEADGGDNDGDGVCANEDCDDNDPLAYPGAPCSDGDDCTTGDVMDANCNCAGTPATFGPSLQLTIVLDNYPEETSWDIRNSSDAVVASGGTYNGYPDGSTVEVPISLSAGTYSFTIYDGYGDGICCNYGLGSYLLESGGSTVASGGAFANSETTDFCIVTGSDPCSGLGGDSDGDGTCDANDGCPNDPNKTAPGDCGCGNADTDSDSDGAADCLDECPNDPGKTEPGICGCGTADTDSDLDGVADCDDGCPNDPGKTSPGQCGCGIPDIDSDFDGLLDCNDNCPNDPGKTDPGICGCGVPDTDSDGDGTADCDDACPNDPGKTLPGDCGCGVPDVDSDGDGTADCIDECPDDPDKTAPGDCGCGVPDVDSDGDGTADCTDDCPDDPGKTDPGICGCGTADTDSDFDGVADCNDGCPDDPAKVSPGQCGCGVPDIDSDFDGLLDCNDNCPNDPAKTDPGICGCGVPDADGDGDGTADCIDACPNDPNKTDPGDCGCGVPDADSDGDGTADCADACPDDPEKTSPGDCGCGVPDTDTDSDGSADCIDECPNDPGKTDPGICGCGTADTDADGDGIADCNDGCPDDPTKTAPGVCGCGVSDADSDGDGTADCNDACSDDPDKIAPGDCGCGTADTDNDGDGIADCNDICPGGDDTIDLNGNGLPDACDCIEALEPFPNSPLLHAGLGSSSTTFTFNEGSYDASFTVSGLDAVLNGQPDHRYEEVVTVSYVDGNGNSQVYGTYYGTAVLAVDVLINGEIQSVSVTLADSYDGLAPGVLSVDLSPIDFCSGTLPCPDADEDGICDFEDVCPAFDDNLLGTACDDGEPCTVLDTWTTCFTCAGTATVDSDGDGVCDALDICPGGDDHVDSDDDGLPDHCEFSICTTVNSQFNTNPLTHSGSGSAVSSVITGSNAVPAFTISGLDSKTNGLESRRYIEQVTVTYVDAYGQLQTYGSFRGDQVSTVAVQLMGRVQTVSVWLTDIYAGATESFMSVDLSTVTSCATEQPKSSRQVPVEAVGNGSMRVKVYPNPSNGQVFIALDDIAAEATVDVYDMVGGRLGSFVFNDLKTLPLDLTSLDINNQFILIRITSDEGAAVVKKVMLVRD